MPQQLLHHAKVGAPVKQVGGCAVTQPVRAEVGRVGQVREQLVHHLAHLAGVDPATAPGNHSPEFLLDEKALDVGFRALLQVSLDFLHGTTG